MGYEDRSNQIMSLLRKCGTVQVREISEQMQVSQVTVRKDLQRLEAEGKLRRTHGGAAAKGAVPGGDPRYDTMRRIAERAAAEIQPGDCVIMNAGNTTLLTARKLLGKSNITIITNSVGIARELARQVGIKVIFLGGEVNSGAVFTYGWDATNQLEQYKANKLILSASGISCTSGVTTRHMEAANLLRKMIARTRTVIAVADDTKIGLESFYHVDDLHIVDMLVTNATPKTEPELQKIETAGIRVCRC